jgi:hypothetical protein
VSPSKHLPAGLEFRAQATVEIPGDSHLEVRDTERPPPPIFMSTDSATRKLMPVDTGFNAYFPRAMKLVAFLSRAANEKHNPGQPLHWAKEKSTDEPDALMRHTLDEHQGMDATETGLEALGKLCHKTQRAWRAMAALERAAEAVEREYLDEIADPDEPIPYSLTSKTISAADAPVVSCCTATHAGGRGACNGYPVPTCPTL